MKPYWAKWRSKVKARVIWSRSMTAKLKEDIDRIVMVLIVTIQQGEIRRRVEKDPTVSTG